MHLFAGADRVPPHQARLATGSTQRRARSTQRNEVRPSGAIDRREPASDTTSCVLRAARSAGSEATRREIGRASGAPAAVSSRNDAPLLVRTWK
jgi:hypothetical protein